MGSEPNFPEDFLVLEHLRGYPDDLASKDDFPAPIFAQDHRRLWRRADVLRYLTDA